MENFMTRTTLATAGYSATRILDRQIAMDGTPSRAPGGLS